MLDSMMTLNSLFHTPLRPLDDKFHQFVDQQLSHLTVSKKCHNLPSVIWPKERYRLERSSFYASLSLEQQQDILVRLDRLNLSLSYWIEKSGHMYGAKMIMLSPTLEEKSLYALFCAEEAIHLQEFKNFMNFTPSWHEHGHPMLEPLAKAITNGNAGALVFVVQVLLEGFGLSHYHGLMQSCLLPELKASFARILKDEARHHGAGVILSAESSLDKETIDQIFEYSREFIQALQHAHWIKKCVEAVAGPMSTSLEKNFWQELEFEKEKAYRRAKLREMVQKVDRYGLVSRLESEGVF